MKGGLWAVLLASLTVSVGATPVGTASLHLGKKFSPAVVQQLPLCLVLNCRLTGHSTTIRKDEPLNPHEEYTYTLSNSKTKFNTARMVIRANKDGLVSSAQLYINVPLSAKLSSYQSLILSWGDSFGLSARNLAPCAQAHDLKSLSRQPKLQGLRAPQQGFCDNYAQGTGRELYFQTGLDSLD